MRLMKDKLELANEHIAVSPDRSHFFTTDERVRVWDASTGDQLCSPISGFGTPDFSDDSNEIVFRSNNDFSKWPYLQPALTHWDISVHTTSTSLNDGESIAFCNADTLFIDGQLWDARALAPVSPPLVSRPSAD